MATRIPLGLITQDLADFRRAIEPFFDEPRRSGSAAAQVVPALSGLLRQEAPGTGGRSILPLDVFTVGDDVVVVAAIPGIDPEKISISVEKNLVTISGSTGTVGDSEEAQASTWFLHEIPRGSFKRSLQLPFDVDPDRADATFDTGMLRMTLPKREAAKPQTIRVKVASGAASGTTSGAASASNSVDAVPGADAIEVEATAAPGAGQATTIEPAE